VRQDAFDLVVVGAGINGAGIAHDAAIRGLSVLLLDARDVASGTTSASTRLIHGGLRYLEHGDIALVRESLRERETLLRLAPHLVRPLPILVPLYSAARRRPWHVRLAMLAYDGLSGGKSLPRHRMLDAAEALALEPALRPGGLRGAALFWDAQVEYPERLALENVLAARAAGAEVRTYTRVSELVVGDGAVRGVRHVDVLTGEEGVAAAAVTVNATGPWVDRLAPPAVRARRLVGGTKGAHVVVGPFPGAPRHALYVESAHDGRPCFVIPWDGRWLIGTTDERFDGDPADAVPTEAEVTYLLRLVNDVIPGAGLVREDVVDAHAGVRPLRYSPGRGEGRVTRRHAIHGGPPGIGGLLTVVGGKLTTYRRLAELAVDAAYAELGRPAPPCTTAERALPGAAPPAAVADRLAASGVVPEAADRLGRVYGARALELAELCRARPGMARSLPGAADTLAGEVAFAIEREGARTVDDVVLRRAMLGRGRAADTAAAVARLAMRASVHGEPAADLAGVAR
jgi:glycerol-3-phosphate dehydrogenase